MSMPAVILRPPLSDVRTYIYAADLFDQLVAATGTSERAQLRLTRIADNPIELRHDAPEPQSDAFCGLFDYRSEGELVRSWLKSVPGEVIGERSSLMDLEVTAGAQLGSDTAVAARLDECSIARTALVLTVYLLEQLFPEDTLNLAEIDADPGLSGGRQVSVRLIRQIRRFLIVSVSADGAHWGQFTLAATPPSSEAG